MDKAAIIPTDEEGDLAQEEQAKLSAFRDFVDTLDMDDLEEA
jgi:hypothetical protein